MHTYTYTHSETHTHTALCNLIFIYLGLLYLTEICVKTVSY